MFGEKRKEATSNNKMVELEKENRFLRRKVEELNAGLDEKVGLQGS